MDYANNDSGYSFFSSGTEFNKFNKSTLAGIDSLLFAFKIDKNGLDTNPVISLNGYNGTAPPNIYTPIFNTEFSTELDSTDCITEKDSIHFTNLSDSGFISFSYYFGDGDSIIYTPSKKAKDVVAHKYLNPGIYYVKLTGVKNTCGYTIWYSDTLNIYYFPNTAFIKDTAYYNCKQYEYKITDTSTTADSVRLDFGSGFGGWGTAGKTLSNTYT